MQTHAYFNKVLNFMTHLTFRPCGSKSWTQSYFPLATRTIATLTAARITTPLPVRSLGGWNLAVWQQETCANWLAAHALTRTAQCDFSADASCSRCIVAQFAAISLWCITRCPDLNVDLLSTHKLEKYVWEFRGAAEGPSTPPPTPPNPDGLVFWGLADASEAHIGSPGSLLFPCTSRHLMSADGLR